MRGTRATEIERLQNRCHKHLTIQKGFGRFGVGHEEGMSLGIGYGELVLGHRF
jgi:hypothetical protein